MLSYFKIYVEPQISQVIKQFWARRSKLVLLPFKIQDLLESSALKILWD